MADTFIYLDNAATTRVAPAVAKVVDDCMQSDFGNPSSAHHAGVTAEKRLKAARRHVLAAIGDDEGRHGDIYWTSGGTESDALGVMGAARARRGLGKHILFSTVEHPAVRESAKHLAIDGWRSDAIPVTQDGIVEVQAVLDAVEDDTTVIAVMLVNNEIGTINPVADIAAAVHEKFPAVHVHCDAVQGLGKIAVDVGSLGADSVAFAGHKLHAPKGVGALWVRSGVRLEPLWSGGGQQEGVRSGTFNVPGIAGFGEAARLASIGIAERQERWAGFANTIIAATAGCGVKVRHNGGNAPRAPHVLSLAFKDVPAEPLLHVLESRGILVSAGSACAERDRKPSPVLSAIGVGPNYGTVRISFGRDTTAAEVATAADGLVQAVRDF